MSVVWLDLVREKQKFAQQEAGKIYIQMTARRDKARIDAENLAANNFESAALRRRTRAFVYNELAKAAKQLVEDAGGTVID